MIQLTEKEQLARPKLCLPLDGLNTREEIWRRVKELKDFIGLFKIGKESFTRLGIEALNVVYEAGGKVFLDLKYHDIPNTVKGAAAAATEHNVYMFNVHASGGYEMMKAAVGGAEEATKRYNMRKPKIVGVTVLTSINQDIMNQQLRVPGSVDEQVLHLARMSHKAGLDGIVCSGADLRLVSDKDDLRPISEKLPTDFMYVVPGIQGPNTPAGADQKRVMTPGNAIQDGASILVVGRAITGPKTPEERQKAAYEVLQDMAKYL